MEARYFNKSDEIAWNALNRVAPSGHFLFDRQFMTYHEDRFADASVVVVSDAGDIIGVFPANRSEEIIWSHQGLTFGGLVLAPNKTLQAIRALECCAEFFRLQGFKRLIYKPLPHIYNGRPCEADLYWLFRRGARLVRRDLSTTIDLGQPITLSSRRRRGVSKALKAGVAFGPSDDWSAFWSLLEAVLGDRHAVRPVHTSAEMQLLAARFPNNIQLFTATVGAELVAGTVMFFNGGVAHAQYIAASEAGRALSALDGLFDRLIKECAAERRWFDFGISTEQQGRVLNEGLLNHKEEFGGGPVVYDTYELGLS